MYTGSIGAFSNREHWNIVSPLIDDDGSEVTLTGATIEFFITNPNTPKTAEVSASTADGKITLPSATTFQIALSPDDVSNLCAGQYSAFLRVTIDDVTTQILAGEVQVVNGGPS